MDQIENRMVVDSCWNEENMESNKLPVCECCEEKIHQFVALHILSGKKRIWICDQCIEDMKEVTGW